MKYIVAFVFAPGADPMAQATLIQDFLEAKGAHGSRFSENVWFINNVDAGLGAADVAHIFSKAGLAPNTHIFVTEVTANTFSG